LKKEPVQVVQFKTKLGARGKNLTRGFFTRNGVRHVLVTEARGSSHHITPIYMIFGAEKKERVGVAYFASERGKRVS